MPCGQKQHKTEAILLTNSIKTEKKNRERSTSKKHLKKEAAELFSHVSRLAFLPAERRSSIAESVVARGAVAFPSGLFAPSPRVCSGISSRSRF